MVSLSTIASGAASLVRRVMNGYHMTDVSYGARRAYVERSRDARKDIPQHVRQSLLDWSRELERKDGLFARFLDLCEQYIVGPTGLRITSSSQDLEFAAESNRQWDEWQPYADIASRHSFGLLQGLIVREVMVAGECFVNLITSPDSGRPRVQLIPAEMIGGTGCPSTWKDGVGGIADGVRMNAYGRPEAYLVRSGYDGSEVKFTPVTADSIIHIFEPTRIGQTRGLPIIYPVIADLVDLKDLQAFEMKAAKAAAAVDKVVKVTGGEISADRARRMRFATQTVTDDDGSKRTVRYKQVIGPETIVLEPGDEYEQFASNRPSVAVQQFWDYVSARAAAGMGIPIEVLIMRSLQGTMTRAALDMASGFFRARSSVFAEAFGRVREHVMEYNVPEANRPNDWRKIRFTPPRAINVDVGRNSAAVISEWQTGFRTLESIAAESGQDWQDILAQRAIEATRAKELEKANGLTEGSLLGGIKPAAKETSATTATA